MADPPQAAALPGSKSLRIEKKSLKPVVVPRQRIEEIAVTSALTCPECRTVLYELKDERVLRFRCQLGHAFLAKTLQQDLAAEREDALWAAVRAVLEEAELARLLAQDLRRGSQQTISFLTEIAHRADNQIDQLRHVIASVSDVIEPDVLDAIARASERTTKQLDFFPKSPIGLSGEL